MASLHSSQLLSSSSHIQVSSKIALKTHHNALSSSAFKLGSSPWIKECNPSHGGAKPKGFLKSSTPKIFNMMNIASGQPGDPRKAKLDNLVLKARQLWDNSPQPVKSFPWNRAIDNFIQLTVDLVLEVVKYLSVPLLVVTSLSEMSYCARQKKLKLILIPLFIGISVAGVLRQTALDLSPRLKDAEVPWHLVCMAIFFTLLKLPGPHYPYWGRIFIPHFANGGLFRTLWFAFLWSRRPKQPSGTTLVPDSEEKS